MSIRETADVDHDGGHAIMVEVTFEARCPEITEKEVGRIVRATLDYENADLDLSLVFVDDAKIQKINREFLDHDWPTDVIAFDLGDEGPGPSGEIYVSVDTARREAKERGIEPAAEMLFYCVHGTLHLLGYDDHDVASRRRMHRRQREILKKEGYEVPC